ncbi:MAG: lysostaphin resistance A-like protein [Candidatus Aminicenantia bacterium]
MENKISPYSRTAINHVVLLVIVFAIMHLLPGGPVKWGVNLRDWQRSLILGVILGVAIGILFSLFSYGSNITRWDFINLMTQLKDKENIILLLSQVFIIGFSEELFFRGILVTYLMRRYSMNLIGIHLGVIIVSIMFASIQFYKLLFGAPLGNVFPLVIGGFVYGLVLGWIYQKTGSLIGSIITHNLGNSLMFLVSLGI